MFLWLIGLVLVPLFVTSLAEAEQRSPALPQLPCQALLGQDFTHLPAALLHLSVAEEVKGRGAG